MRVAVVGATGLVGRQTMSALGDLGHDAVPIARSHGVDVVTGAGLDDALRGSLAVIDILNTTETERSAVERFFATTTEQLLASEQRVGVTHHVLLSIVGLDRVQGNAHYAGKRRQEELVQTGSVPWTIQRAAQFFDFAAMVASWTTRDGVAGLPCSCSRSRSRTSPRCSPASPPAHRRASPPTSWARSCRTSSTWPGARWPPEMTPRRSRSAGATGP
jgi:uncharacterized protein YbjT (DUF2867 family)